MVWKWTMNDGNSVKIELLSTFPKSVDYFPGKLNPCLQPADYFSNHFPGVCKEGVAVQQSPSEAIGLLKPNNDHPWYLHNKPRVHRYLLHKSRTCYCCQINDLRMQTCVQKAAGLNSPATTEVHWIRNCTQTQLHGQRSHLLW